jgi:glycogen synthase
MRILLTSDTVGGVWQYSMELMRALGPHGVEFALATMGAPLTPDQRRELQSNNGIAIFESAYRLEWMEDPWDDLLRAGQWLMDIEQRVGPDIIHLNGYCHGVLPWSCPVLMVAHSCCLSWWEAVKHEPAPGWWDRYRTIVTRGLRSADRVVAPTRTMLREIDRLYGPLPPARVIPNSRDASRFAPGPKDQVVLTAGRVWDEAKNVMALCQCAPLLRWPVQVAGESRSPDGRSGQMKGVHLLGRLPQEQLALHYARAGIYALPARYEPFGLSALEAGLSGCALVLGDIPALREVWGSAALFVPPDDVQALAETINRVADDRALRVDLSAAAQARAFCYAPQRMAVQYLDLYQEMVGEMEAELRQPLEPPPAAPMPHAAALPVVAPGGQDAGLPA